MNKHIRHVALATVSLLSMSTLVSCGFRYSPRILSVGKAFHQFDRSQQAEQFNQADQEGNTDYEHHRYDLAVQQYTRMIAISPHSSVGYLLRGNAYSQENHFAQSIADYSMSMKYERDHALLADLYFNRGNSYEQMGKTAQAVSNFTEAIRLNPLIPDAHEARMMAYFTSHRYAQALPDCNVLIARHPQEARTWGMRGKIESAEGDTMHAAKDFEHALALDSTYLPAYNGLEEQDERARDYAAMLMVCQQQVVANPSNPYSWGDLGWAQYKAGRLKDAIATDQKSLSLSGTQGAGAAAVAHFNLGLCYAVQGNADRAEAEYKTGLASATPEERQDSLDEARKASQGQPQSVALKKVVYLLAP